MEDQDSDVSDFSDFEDARDPDLLQHVKIESVTSKVKEVMSKLKDRRDVVDERRLKDSLSTLKIKSKRIAEEALKSNLDENSKEKVKQIQNDSKKIFKDLRASKNVVELRKEVESLGEDVINSEEAKKLNTTSKQLLESLEKSDTGKTVLNAITEVLEDREEEFVDTADRLLKDTSSALMNESEDNDKSVNLMLNKVTEIIVGDGKNSDGDEERKKMVSASLENASVVTKKLSQLTSSLSENSDVSESVMRRIKWLKNNKIGQSAIQGVSDVLEAVDKHGVDRSVEDAKRILLDPEKREQFFVNIKNTALAYLMEYLPKVKVPKIVDTKDGVDYELSNIKISGFRVPADDVSLIVVRNSELHLRAKNIVFDVKGIKWTYAQQSFPYLNGEGVVDCRSEKMKLIVVFRLDLVKNIVKRRHLVKDALENEGGAKNLIESLKEDADAPILVMDDPYIKLEHLELEIRGSALSWLYNAVVSVFNQQVSDAMSAALTSTMKTKSGVLLDKLNEMGKHYWPLLLRVAENNVDKVKKVTDSAKKVTEKIRDSVLESDDLQVISSELKNKTESILNLKSVKNTRSKISSLAKKVARSEVTKNAIEITKDAKRTLGVNIKVVDDIDDGDDNDDDDDDGVKIVTKKKTRPKRYQVDFMKGTLGFTFRVLRGTAVVQRLVRDEDGGAQQAELLGVRPGDVIERIAETSVEGLSTKRITAMVRCNPRPLAIDFRTTTK
eukprot:g5237.t1